jgi:hypothetical protein
MELVIGCFLDTRAIDPLAKVSLRVQEADSYKGQTEIAGLLTVVTREDAQTTRVDWE